MKLLRKNRTSYARVRLGGGNSGLCRAFMLIKSSTAKFIEGMWWKSKKEKQKKESDVWTIE